ncbi:MAG: c-type cytochrome, partial [Planctomycetales bacterium]|nr:c-type cytochrome [Planctomycetales bacterium]
MRPVAVALAFSLLSLSLSACCPLAHGQSQPTPLERQLLAAKPEDLVKQALETGNPRRGAMLFYQQRLACARCHLPSGGLAPLGPDLTVADASDPVSPILLIESLLRPSKRIRKGYQPTLLQLEDGRRLRGIVLRETADSIELRDISRDGAVVRVSPESVTARKLDEVSLMPEGLASQLTSQRQFLDLVKYLHEIVTGGSKRAEELAPPVAMRGIRPLPEYEGRVDHRGILAGLDDQALRRGQEVYESLCVNCHGTHDRPGSLPTSLRFASGKFKRGGDPYSMYLTLTHGYGQMVAQTWMVPTQKYDVIHYIRERYLKSHNPDQYVPVGEAYLASLPVGDTRGPAPVKFEPWATMNYGHTLTHTYEVGDDGANFAYKGVAVRLDPGPGGVSRGRQWMVFDEDTMRWAAGWSGEQFIDWNGIMFNGRHNAHPRLSGRVEFQNPTGPGWSRPGAPAVDLEDPRLRGRDQRPYGPLPREWAKFRGLYHFGDRAVVSYSVGSTSVLEMPAAEPHPADNATSIFERVLQIGPRKQPLAMVVARAPRQGVLRQVPVSETHSVAIVAAPAKPATDVDPKPLVFDGQRYLQLDSSSEFKLTDHGYSLDACVKTKRGGVLFAKTAEGPKWVPDGKAWFIRGGRLVFDIGWVGAVTGKTRVDDGRWHQLAMTCSAAGKIRLYVDGMLDGEGQLKPKGPANGHVARIGFASPNFPTPTPLNGELGYLRIHARELSAEQVRSLTAPAAPDSGGNATDASVLFHAAAAEGKLSGKVLMVSETAAPATGSIVAAATGVPEAHWTLTQRGDLLLHIPAGETPIRASLRIASS